MPKKNINFGDFQTLCSSTNLFNKAYMPLSWLGKLAKFAVQVAFFASHLLKSDKEFRVTGVSDCLILCQKNFIKKDKNCYFFKTEACGQIVLPVRSFFIGQKLVENAKNGQTSDFWNPKSSGQTVLPDSSILIEQKLENAINCKIKYNILSGQKLLKSAKNGQFGDFLKNWSLKSNSVTRQLNFAGKCQNSKIQMQQFWVIVLLFCF